MQRLISMAIGLVAGNADLVLVRVAEIRAVVIRVIVGARSRRAFADAAVFERGSMGCSNLSPVGRQEGDHLTLENCVATFRTCCGTTG
jgi:hypothetical protein